MANTGLTYVINCLSFCRKKLEVTFQDNPHVEYVELHGNISYPNILLSKTAVTFASTLNDTITAQSLTVTNTCEVPVKYHWDLTNGRIGDVGSADGAMVDVAANELFDIRPIEGLLHPGESESLRISYFAKANLKAHASATMHVQGGPDTHVTLQAMASKTCFHLEPRLIKCGLCQYSQTVHRDITIANPSMCVAIILKLVMSPHHTKSTNSKQTVFRHAGSRSGGDTMVKHLQGKVF